MSLCPGATTHQVFQRQPLVDQLRAAALVDDSHVIVIGSRQARITGPPADVQQHPFRPSHTIVETGPDRMVIATGLREGIGEQQHMTVPAPRTVIETVGAAVAAGLDQSLETCRMGRPGLAEITGDVDRAKLRRRFGPAVEHDTAVAQLHRLALGVPDRGLAAARPGLAVIGADQQVGKVAVFLVAPLCRHDQRSVGQSDARLG